ncbi:MAG: hypothetical protein LBL05_05060, partial [Synergistaceae bacterium]|nr:hypothetical protein [Synergistaceae bacterium]
MKFHARVCVLLSLCITVLCSPAYADGFEITSVDFYPSGAKITLQVQSDGRFAFELPGAYDMNSVRCLNAEQVTSVKTENIYLGNETPPELESAQSRIDEATRTISLIEGRKSALEQTKAILQAPYSFQNGNWSVSLSADDVINYAARAEKIRLDTESTLADIDMELTRARKDLEKTLKE